MESGHTAVLYESVASDISALIESGTLAAGDRVPSVRRLSRQRRVSISTVLQAYQLLENKGLIEARPQSGYYVRTALRPVREPALSQPPKTPRPVGVHDLVRRILAAGQDSGIVPLGAAFPSAELVPVAKLQRMLSTVARRDPGALTTYGMPPGRGELRRQIARRTLEWGCNLRADELIVTNGCMEALNLCLRAVARPGDIIALESPTYFGMLQIIESLGLKALEVPTHPREGISLDALALALERERVKACLISTNVSNPLGGIMPDSSKRKLVKMLAEHNVPLVEDAVYAELYAGAAAPIAAKAYDKTGNVMLCASFTKTLVPGFRVGWVAPGNFKARVEMLKYINSVGTSDVLQLAIAEFLANGGYERHLRAVRRTYARQVELTTNAICRSFPRGTRVTRPAGGFVLWVELPQGTDAIELYEQALRENIGIAPGPMFSASNRYRNCVRISCGVPWSARIEEAIARVGGLAGKQGVPASRRKG